MHDPTTHPLRIRHCSYPAKLLLSLPLPCLQEPIEERLFRQGLETEVQPALAASLILSIDATCDHTPRSVQALP